MSQIVGEAHVIVRAITNKVDGDIRKAFSGSSSTGKKAGESLGEAFTRGFNKNVNQNSFSRIADGLRTLSPGAEAARKAFQKLLATGYILQTALAAVVPAIFSLISGLGALIGTAGGAASTVVVLGNTFFALAAAMITARLALGGVGKALSALNKNTGGGGGGAAAQAQEVAAKAVESAEKSLARTIEQNRESLINANNDVRDAQIGLNAALKAGREEIQQLGFDAEDAALSEKKASLDLEKARIALAKAQDLPPNSRARQEAELAYQEAELNLRKAKDRSADLNKEQDRLAKTGVKGTAIVIAATDALARAEANKSKVVRDAARSEADAQDALAEAKNNAADAGGGGGGGADPLAGLNQAQINFVNFIQSTVMPLLKQLKVTASEAFLPLLTTAISIVASGAFTTINKGIGQIGVAMGNAAISLANAIVNSQNLANLSSLFTSSAALIESFGRGLGSLFGIVLSLLSAASPIAQRFFGFLEKKLGTFDKFLKSVDGNKSLVDFFGLASDAMAGFGDIFGNLFDTFGGIISANLGPGTGGGMLLQWIQDVTQRWADFNNSLAGQNALKEYFNGAASNAQSILQAVGSLFSIFSDLAADPAIKTTFDLLKTGAPAMRTIAENALAAGPNLAALVVSITNFIAKLTDTGAIQVFFDTFKGVVDFLSGLFNNGIVGPLLVAHGRIVAFTAVFGILGTIGGFAFKVIIGGLINLFSPIGKVIGFLGTLISSFAGATLSAAGFTQGLVFMTYSTNPLTRALGLAGLSVQKFGLMLKGALTGPIGIVIGIIALLVGAFILLYNTSDTFKAQMDAIFAQLSAIFATAASQILDAITPLIPVLAGAFQTIVTSLVPVVILLAKAFGDIITAIAPLIPVLLGALIPAIVGIVTAIVPLVTQLITALVPAFTQILNAVLPLVTMLITSLVPVIVLVISAIAPLIVQIINALLPAFVAIVEAVGPLIAQLATALVPIIQLLAEVLAFLIPIIVEVVKVIIDVLIAVIKFLVDAITSFATDWDGTWQQVFDFVSTIWNNILIFFQTIWTAISDFFVGAFKAYFDFWVGFWTGIFSTIFDIFTNIYNFIRDVINNIVNSVRTVFNNLGAFWSNFWNGVSSVINSVWSGIVGFVKSYVNSIISLVEGMVNGVIGAINGLLGGINGALGAIGGAIGVNLSVGQIPRVSLPRLAAGGTVFPSAGGSIVNVAEAGRPERIEPLDANGLSARDKAMIELLSGGGSGATFNIYQLPGEDQQELAERISRILSFRQRKGNIA